MKSRIQGLEEEKKMMMERILKGLCKWMLRNDGKI